MIIGVDPFKGSYTATALDAATNMSVSSMRVVATIGVYQQLLRWARQFGERRWAVGCGGWSQKCGGAGRPQPPTVTSGSDADGLFRDLGFASGG